LVAEACGYIAFRAARGERARGLPAVNVAEGAARRVDRFQQTHQPFAFVFAVVKKFGDDAGSALAALLTYYGFLSLFPLLLIMITVLGMVVSPATEQRIVHSTLAQFPIVGDQLAGPSGISALKAGSTPALILGLLWLTWGSLGVTQAAQRAMAEVWNVPGVIRPGFVPRLGRSALFLCVLLLDVAAVSVLAGYATLGTHATVGRVAAVLVATGTNVLIYALAFRVLTPKSIGTRCLIPGAIAGGIAWTLLQYLGTLFVAHQLRNTSAIYGYFASVLGLIGFLFLAAQITLYAAEFNVVRERRLWPRSMVQPPLTKADIEALTQIAEVGHRRPEQRVEVSYPGVDGPGDGREGGDRGGRARNRRSRRGRRSP
jgi:YihY family inner membrane protein